MKAKYVYHPLNFIKPGGTSRGILHDKDSWFLTVEQDGRSAYGECSTIKGLSLDSQDDVNEALEDICHQINEGIWPDERHYGNLPAVRFCLEQAALAMQHDVGFKLFDNDFLSGKPIPINGLVWMGTKSFMFDQIKEKIEAGFNCIKLKIAAIDYEEELSLIKYIRDPFDESQMQIRVDANGGFDVEEVQEKLKRLSDFAIHSIEQPIGVGQHDEMAELCEKNILDIALDEELIGVHERASKSKLLSDIRPQYIILKPSLIGGFRSADEWIDLARGMDIEWWATSALESNLGLNAIAQWVSNYEIDMPQGLGTGQLFSNNIASPLVIKDAQLIYDRSLHWDIEKIYEFH